MSWAPMKTLTGILLAAALLVITGTASAGYFTTITIDGDFSDWTAVPILDFRHSDGNIDQGFF